MNSVNQDQGNHAVPFTKKAVQLRRLRQHARERKTTRPQISEAGSHLSCKREFPALTEVKFKRGRTECDGHNPNDLHIASHQRT